MPVKFISRNSKFTRAHDAKVIIWVSLNTSTRSYARLFVIKCEMDDMYRFRYLQWIKFLSSIFLVVYNTLSANSTLVLSDKTIAPE